MNIEDIETNSQHHQDKQGTSEAVTPPNETAPSTQGQAHSELLSLQGESPFEHRRDGLYLREDKGIRKICSPIQVVALTRDENNSNWGRLVSLKDPDHNAKQIAIPMTTITSSNPSCLQALVDNGLVLADARSQTKQALVSYLSEPSVQARVRCVSKPGWHDYSFVLPHRTFQSSTSTDEKTVLQAETKNNRFSNTGTSGTLTEWQDNIGRYLPGNSRLMFSVSAGFAAPLLYLMGEPEGGGFHLFGGSSIGKTTALVVAGSVWGGGASGYHQTWRTTDNGLEFIAEAHNDSLLCLDEMGQVDPKHAGEIAYMLANGEGKIRSKQDGGIQIRPTWRTIFLSTGEVTLADKMAEDGKVVKAGQETRQADIPADAGADLGLFEDLHGKESAGELAYHLKVASRKFYGTPIEAMLDRLVTQSPEERATLINGLKRRKAELVESILPVDPDGQVRRVAERFALVAVAGELAIDYGIIPAEEGDAASAAENCFFAWLEHRGGAGAQEHKAFVEQVRYYLEKHQTGKFASEDGAHTPYGELAGYRKTFTSGNHKGETAFAIFPEVFGREVCKGFNPAMVAKVLQERGLLLTSSKGRYARRVRINDSNNRYYCVSTRILQGDADDEPDEDLDDGYFGDDLAAGDF